MVPSGELTELSGRLWRDRCRELGGRVAEIDGFLERLQGAEQVYLRYVLGTLPPSDLAEYGPDFLLKILRQAMDAREAFPWCESLPEVKFLLYVAYPRIHDEALSDCRELFRAALTPRIQGLSLQEAILEVNRWCAEQVAYRSTDTRTASALEVYRRGLGRCGEESVFAVTALRSVGIAARQVYCPWWSHCDDNHAWVECWDGESWRFLGACEPEPELDRGWFPMAAGRAMLIHTRVFMPEIVDFLLPDGQDETLYAVHGMVYEAVTERYARTQTVTVRVTEPDGKPAKGTAVTFSVLNMGAFRPIAGKRTDEVGTVRLRLGMGSVKIVCRSDAGLWGEILLDSVKETAVTMVLREAEPMETRREFDFSAPEGNRRFPKPLSPEAKRVRKAWLETAAALREARPGVPLPAWEGRQGEILTALTEKDRACGVDAAVLKDGEAAFRFERGIPQGVFQEAVLSPRIGNEPLTPWREKLFRALGEERRGLFAAEPQLAWDWICRTFLRVDSHPTLVASPMATLRIGAGNEASLRVLFCGACRCVGVPARLSPIDDSAEYWRDGRYHSAEHIAFAALKLDGLGKPVTVSWVDIEELPLFTGTEGELSLAPGRYRLIAATRLPSGGQLVREQILRLAAGERQEVAIPERVADIQALLTRMRLPEFELWDETGRAVSNKALPRGKTLVCWLEPGREPTEHLLRELAQAGRKIYCPVYFILPVLGVRDPSLNAALAALPNAKVWRGDFQDTEETLARSVFAEPGVLPLTLLMDTGICVYSSAGYNVGTVELLEQILRL